MFAIKFQLRIHNELAGQIAKLDKNCCRSDTVLYNVHFAVLL